jgi:hypothetical protein
MTDKQASSSSVLLNTASTRIITNQNGSSKKQKSSQSPPTQASWNDSTGGGGALLTSKQPPPLPPRSSNSLCSSQTALRIYKVNPVNQVKKQQQQLSNKNGSVSNFSPVSSGSHCYYLGNTGKFRNKVVMMLNTHNQKQGGGGGAYTYKYGNPEDIVDGASTVKGGS